MLTNTPPFNVFVFSRQGVNIFLPSIKIVPSYFLKLSIPELNYLTKDANMS